MCKSLLKGHASIRVVRLIQFLLIGVVFSTLTLNAAKADDQKGFQAIASPLSDTPALLGRFGELIARERAYIDTAYELVNHARGASMFEMDDSMLDAVLGEEFFELYDEILPKLEALGQKSRRDELGLRFKPEAQQQLIAGKRVAGINDGAVNNIVAHYKIAIEQLDISVRQLLLAESHLVRRSADELSQAFDKSGDVIDYVSYIRASRLVSAPRQVKGFVQPRCKAESDAIKQSRSIRSAVDDKFYIDENRVFQTTVQAVYDAARMIESQAMLLSEDGSHC